MTTPQKTKERDDGGLLGDPRHPPDLKKSVSVAPLEYGKPPTFGDTESRILRLKSLGAGSVDMLLLRSMSFGGLPTSSHWRYPRRVPGRIVPIYLNEDGEPVSPATGVDASADAENVSNAPAPPASRFHTTLLKGDSTSNLSAPTESGGDTATTAQAKDRDAMEAVESFNVPTITKQGSTKALDIASQDVDISLLVHPPAANGINDESKLTLKRQLSEASERREAARLRRFLKLLQQPNLDMEELRRMSWSGIPAAVRSTAWMLLCGYLPANESRRQATLERKRTEYRGFIEKYYGTRHDKVNQALHHQILIDLPRTNPRVPLFQQEGVHNILERILYIWAIRHPASGYVQGINDLVTPFFTVFLQAHYVGDVETANISEVDEAVLDAIEADSYWCMTKLLDGIQDNYTSAQPGIQRKVLMLEELVQRLDAPLHEHLLHHDVQYIHFAFRWMNCMLMRELPLRSTIRMWDTYLSETNGFADLHLYVCAAFLTRWSAMIRAEQDFPNIITLLQNPPTQGWGDQEVQELVAEAYVWKSMYANAPKHLQS